MIRIIILLVLVFPAMLMAQKKVLGHQDYDSWNTLESIQISRDGQMAVWVENPARGDGRLIICNTTSKKYDTLARASSPVMPASGKFVAARVSPFHEQIRQLKILKKKKDEFPKDTAVIWMAGRDSLWSMAPVKEMHVPQAGLDIALILYDKEKAEKAPETEAQPDSTKQKEEIQDTSKIEVKKPYERTYKGTRLSLIRPIEGDSICFMNVDEFSISRNGTRLIMIKNRKDSIDSTSIYVFDVQKWEMEYFMESAGVSKSPVFSEKGSHAAWLWSPDTLVNKTWRLMHYSSEEKVFTPLTDTLNNAFPEGFTASDKQKPWFSRNEKKLYFGIGQRPDQPPKDTIPDDEKYSLDLWTWTDARLQSHQLKELKSDTSYSFLSVYHLPTGNFGVLGNDTIRQIRTTDFGNDRFALGINEQPYQLENSWTISGLADYYLLDTETGTQQLIKKGITGPVSLSPEGRYFLWYNRSDSSWYALDIAMGTEQNLTSGLGGIFYDDEHDEPSLPRSYGFGGWSKEGSYALINDKFDVWLFDMTGDVSPYRLTEPARTSNTVHRYVRPDPDETRIDLKNYLFFSTFDKTTKNSGFSKLWAEDKRYEELVSGPYSFSFQQKAKEAELFLFRKSDFRLFPDLYFSKGEFRDPLKISNANPELSEYARGNVQLVNFTSRDGQSLNGLLYTPEKLQSKKKYPLIVYFYERSSDGLHRFTLPNPSRSTINIPLYNSQDYVVFVPDIVYKTGYPGQSAYDCIMGGVDDILRQFPFIDSTRMALQGQSWGGYQIAWLITRTDRFKAAMAGAPVSNMTSAYGGIRWESGLVRQFQYEQSQSRLGKNLWEAPGLYIENSPVFAADRVKTPLLMMHNDHDGAVPWYQGIEYFTALRRLKKPVWMLVYNGDGHNLGKWPNRVDLSIRMLQFFDHYLKDQAMPLWMEKGIPATEKGRTHGY